MDLAVFGIGQRAISSLQAIGTNFHLDLSEGDVEMGKEDMCGQGAKPVGAVKGD